MEWKKDMSNVKGAIIEQAKVEASRRIAEQLEEMNSYLKRLADKNCPSE